MVRTSSDLSTLPLSDRCLPPCAFHFFAENSAETGSFCTKATKAHPLLLLDGDGGSALDLTRNFELSSNQVE